MPNATPKPPGPQPFAIWNPQHGVWETTQPDLFGLSAIWPTCGMTRNGSAYRLPPSALLTTRFCIFILVTRSDTVPDPVGLGLLPRRRDPGTGEGAAREMLALPRLGSRPAPSPVSTGARQDLSDR